MTKLNLFPHVVLSLLLSMSAFKVEAKSSVEALPVRVSDNAMDYMPDIEITFSVLKYHGPDPSVLKSLFASDNLQVA